jgi:hypothetical protein
MTMPARHVLIAALALAATSWLAAGCGGGPSTPGVANVGTGSADASSSGSGSSGSGSGAKRAGDGTRFSRCMRSHGVRNFPDPSAEGGLTINPGMGIDPNSATFKAAERACQKLLDIKPPSAAEQAKMQEQALKFSACMRAHGVPKFPDPQFSGGKATLRLDRRNGIDPSSPRFQAAQKACESLVPGGPKGGPGPGGKTQSAGGGSGT